MCLPISPHGGHLTIPIDCPIHPLHTRPPALQPIHIYRHIHPRVQAPTGNGQRIELSFREKRHSPAPKTIIQKHLQDTSINHGRESKGLCVGINEIIHAEFIREERVRSIEPIGVAPVEEKGRVAAEEEAATNGLAGDGGEEGEVCGARGVGQGDVGDDHVEA